MRSGCIKNPQVEQVHKINAQREVACEIGLFLLLKRVTRVSVETQEIVAAMKALPRQ